jgi:hypothetical protein
VEAGRLTRRYYRQNTLVSSTFTDWPTLEEVLQRWRTAQSPYHLTNHFCQSLFAALFPASHADQMVQLFGGESPFFRPTRLCIQLDEATAPALLAELPWHLACWGDQSLVDNGWTFEINARRLQSGVSLYTLQLKVPFYVALVAPGWEDHVHDVTDLLRNTWPVSLSYVHGVSTVEAIATIFRDYAPKLVYFCGPATVHDNILSVQLATDDGASVAVNVQSLIPPNHRTEIVFLNLLYDRARPLNVGAVLAGPSQHVPLLISQTIEKTDVLEAHKTFRAWLKALLEGEEPVQTLHAVGHPSAVAWSAFERCHIDSTQHHTGVPKERLPHLLLNRTEERVLVNKAVDYLTERRDRRVACLIAFAAPGNHIALFPDQADYYLRVHARDKVSVKVVQVRVPSPLALTDQETFEIAIRSTFKLAQGPLERTLARALTTLRETAFVAGGKGRMPLLLLDWGVWKPAQVALISSVLQAWVTFCASELSRACPSSLRLLSYLALESQQKDHTTIIEVVNSMRRSSRRRQNPAFYLEEPAHLDVIPKDDLEAFFFDNAAQLGCSSVHCEELAHHIYQKTEGHYDTILQLMDKLLEEGASIMLARWEREIEPRNVE